MCQLALLCIPLNPGDLSQAGHSGVTPCCMNEVNPLAFMTPLAAAAAANRLRLLGLCQKSLEAKAVENRGRGGGVQCC